jgi:hypothetical protein
MSGDIQTLNPAGVVAGSSPTFTNITATGTITPSQTSGIVGTTTNNNANAGSVGEFITATVATPGSGLTTATPLNVTSISLTAGDWDVASVIDFLYTGATVTDIRGGPSLTTATLPTQAGGSGLGTDALAIDPSNFVTVGDTQTLDSGPVRVLISATTTVFLVAQATFSAGTVSAFGTIRARRVR